MAFNPAPPPKTALGYYRLLSPNASVRVSPLCLGAMNFGDSWKDFMGECDQKATNEILDFFYQSGGNFIDTANNYQKEESERWIGEWMQARGNRDQMVIATKYTTCYRAGYGDKEILVNTTGNGTKSLHLSVEASLKKLQTSYIDLLYVHWWDFTCSIPELMQSLNTLVQQGKVLYLGISDTPAWIVSKANEYARQNGLRQFSVYQGKWNAGYRDLERDIIPMCESEGMGICPWGALGGGHFKTEEQRKSNEGRKMAGFEVSETDLNVSRILEKIAKKYDTQITSVALAYVMKKVPYVFPIVGGRKIDHLKGNIDGLRLDLTAEDMQEIEGGYTFDLGFPMNFLGGGDPGNIWLMAMSGKQQHVAPPKAIGAVKME